MFGVGAVVAADLVAPNRRASAIALMFTGLTLANILGVPLGTLIGQDHGWRAAFWAITGLGALAFVPVAWLVPNVAQRASAGLRRELSVLGRPEVLLALATTILSSASVFVLFTYVVPILQDVSGFTPKEVTLILFLVGLGFTLGITLGGKLADRGLLKALIGILTTLTLLLLVFPLLLHSRIATLALVFAWAAAAFATVPALQARVVDKAAEAPNLASTLNIGAFNLGNATGAFLGGLVLDQGFGLPSVPLAAAAVALAGLVAAVLAARLDRRGISP
jgi:DHA1 family inner membrane transport protein